MAIGQCRSWGITVARVALAHGTDNAVADKEDSGPLPYWSYPMWALKKSTFAARFHPQEAYKSDIIII